MAAESILAQRLYHESLDAMARMERVRHLGKPTQITRMWRVVLVDDALVRRSELCRGVAERDRVTAIVRNLDQYNWPVANDSLQPNCSLAGAESMLDLLSVTDVAAGYMPAGAKSILSPGKHHSPRQVHYQQVDVWGRDNLCRKPE